MSRLSISLFGKLCVRCGEEDIVCFDSVKQQELLCYLLVYRKRLHVREKLASMLWGASTLTQSKRYLRQAIWLLQSSLKQDESTGIKFLYVDPDWVQVNEQFNFFLDIHQFEQIYTETRDIKGCDLSSQTAARMQETIQLYTGDLLENWYQDWCIFERERFQNMFLGMLQKLIAYCESRQMYQQGLSYCSLILQWDRACERAHRRMMRLRYLAGDRTGALRQYNQCVQILYDELDVAPSSQTTSLYQSIQSDAFPAIYDMDINPSPVLNEKPQSLTHILKRLILLNHMLVKAQQQVEKDIHDVNMMLDRQ